jgi:hypothetical protein
MIKVEVATFTAARSFQDLAGFIFCTLSDRILCSFNKVKRANKQGEFKQHAMMHYQL